MTDKEKLEKLKAEIEKLKDCASPIVVCDTLLSLIDSMQENPCDRCTNRKGCITCENGELKETELSHSEVIKISDQEKPVSDVKTRVKEIFDSCEKIDISDVEKNRVAFGLLELEGFAKIFYEMGKQQEEPVSEDLEEASMQYGEKLDNILAVSIEDDNSTGEYAQEAFMAGAKWQKQQMMKNSVDAGVTDIRTYKEENEVDFTVMYEKGIIPYEIEQEVKLIIIIV